LRPTLLIETGTAFGGSALYYARQFDRVFGYELASAEANRNGIVISIDIESAPMVPVHPRIQYVNKRSSLDAEVLRTVRAIAKTHPGVMVSLDSDHSKQHVLDELEEYAPLVTPGQFLVVEDTNINGRPVEVDWKGGPGPGPAVDEWLPAHPEFERAPLAERYMMTFHTWLRRKAQ
jgi:cephalosporin hydroxylase